MVNFSIPINLQPWQILSDPQQHWDSRFVTVFYGAQLGLYPYYPSEDGTNAFNRGLPQLVNLKEHLERAKTDIMSRIPDPDYNGLAIIDWEPWRPLWERNWNAKKIYKIKSVELVRERHPDWRMTDLVLEAKDEFETAARDMFVGTIRLGKKLRPKALWGFYGFPDCFGQEKYDFQCTEEVKRSNDKIDWIFAESTALFPSIYLLKSHLENPDYVKGRLRETFRVNLRLSQRLGKDVAPVFPYFRSIYMDSPLDFNFLDKGDLYNTIGVASEMGSSGVVIWGNRNDENTSPGVCHRINTYIQSTLGPFIRDTRKLVEQCSVNRCYGKGHCVHKSHLDKDLQRLYSFRKDHNCLKTKIKTIKKRAYIPSPKNSSAHLMGNNTGHVLDIGAVARQTTNDSFLKSHFGVKPLNEKSNKFEIELQGQTKLSKSQSNSSTKSFDQKSQVPSPSHPFTGSLISSHLKHSLLPHMYVLIIGVSIAGAFLFSLIFVALYYYLNINPALQGSSTGKRDAQCADKKKKNEEQDDHTGPKLFPHTIESDTEVDLDSLKSFER